MNNQNSVTSLAEVWIETFFLRKKVVDRLSLPLRKCGLKHETLTKRTVNKNVTSRAEVWIETARKKVVYRLNGVTSLAEVWIETRRY